MYQCGIYHHVFFTNTSVPAIPINHPTSPCSNPSVLGVLHVIAIHCANTDSGYESTVIREEDVSQLSECQAQGQSLHPLQQQSTAQTAAGIESGRGCTLEDIVSQDQLISLASVSSRN